MKKIKILVLALLSVVQSMGQNRSDMLEKSLAAVVTVAVYKTDMGKQVLGFRGAPDLAYEKMLDLSKSKSSGSGFVIRRDEKLYVVTNAHVVEKAAEEDGALVVYSISRKRYRMKVKGGDSFYDLAVLEFVDDPGPEIESLDFRKETARIGEPVYAIGNPLGEYPYTVTDGIISAKNRVREGATGKFGFLQTTATVIWGNSGGPLLDEKGAVLGMNSQIAFAEKGVEDIWQPQINFALESGICARLVSDILTHNGTVQRAWLGLEIAEQYDYDSYRALYGQPWIKRDTLPVFNSLLPGSPAEKVLKGKEGAQILEVNGQSVRSVEEVLGAFEKIKPGAEVTLKIIDKGKTESVAFQSESLGTKHLEAIAKYVVQSNYEGYLTVDENKKVILKSTVKEEQVNPDKPAIDHQEEREQNLRYRGALEEAKPEEGAEYKILAEGVESKNYSSIWRVNTLSDLGAAFRISGLSGSCNVYVADPFGDDPQVIPINPSENDQIFQITLWY